MSPGNMSTETTSSSRTVAPKYFAGTPFPFSIASSTPAPMNSAESNTIPTNYYTPDKSPSLYCQTPIYPTDRLSHPVDAVELMKRLNFILATNPDIAQRGWAPGPGQRLDSLGCINPAASESFDNGPNPSTTKKTAVSDIEILKERFRSPRVYTLKLEPPVDASSLIEENTRGRETTCLTSSMDWKSSLPVPIMPPTPILAPLEQPIVDTFRGPGHISLDAAEALPEQRLDSTTFPYCREVPPSDLVDSPMACFPWPQDPLLRRTEDATCPIPAASPKHETTKMPAATRITALQPLSSDPPKIIIHFIRHGEAEHNFHIPGVRTSDIPDPKLTKEGVRQCISLKETFPHMSSITHILSSPLHRTLQTTEKAFAPLIAKRMKVEVRRKLRELGNIPCNRGASKDILKRRWSRKGFVFDRLNPWWVYEVDHKDEAPENAKKMLWEFGMEALKRGETNEKGWVEMAVISHGGIIRYMAETSTQLRNAAFKSFYFLSEQSAADKSKSQWNEIIETTESRTRRADDGLRTFFGMNYFKIMAKDIVSRNREGPE